MKGILGGAKCGSRTLHTLIMRTSFSPRDMYLFFKFDCHVITILLLANRLKGSSNVIKIIFFFYL